MPPRPENLGFDPAKFPSFRRYPGFDQWQMAKRLAFSSARFVGLQGPPGCGKSALYMATARILGIGPDQPKRGLVLTSTKAQQSQLLDDFRNLGMTDVKGRANYHCREWRSTCDVPRVNHSICRREQRREGCPYQDAIMRAKDSPIPVGNYAFWLTLGAYSDPYAIGNFDLLICDEAHNIVDALTSAATIELQAAELRDFLYLSLPRLDNDLQLWQKWAQTAAEETSDIAAKAQETPRGKKIRSFWQALTTIPRLPVSSWVAERGPSSVNISPVWPEERAESLLFRGIKKIILTSATIYPSIREQLAIPRRDFEWIEVASSYPAKNRPFIYLSTAPELRVDFRMGEGEKRLLVRKIDEIISKWGHLKGIIHCRSYAYQKLIVEKSKHADIMLAPGGWQQPTVKEAIDQLKRQSAGIIVSPALEEGYNFPDDNCRWQIILKVPFLDTRSPLMMARKKTKKRYAVDLTSAKMLQQSLRHVRSEKDWGVTFIVDAHWVYFQKTGYFPKYSKASMKKLPKVPTPKELGFRS